MPLDLRLQEAGGRFEPVRSNTNVDVPKDLSRGVTLTSLGVSLTPVTAHGSPLTASEGSLEGSTVLWSATQNAGAGRQDLATLAKALPTGFELTSMLFSQRSPGQLYFRVGMPAGAHLKAGNGSVQIVEGKTSLADISRQRRRRRRHRACPSP